MATINELVAPEVIDVAFVRNVIESLSFGKPVAPNAIWQCLKWGVELHMAHNRTLSEMEGIIARARESRK